MATQVRGMVRDASSENHSKESGAGAKANMLKLQKKGGGGLVRRKPLGEISNSLKQTPLQQTIKKQSSTGFSFIKEEGAAGVSNGGKRTVVKPQGKAQTAQTAARKPLGDISNSRKLSTNKTSRKSFNESLYSIAEERCLHDHKKCIDAQKNAFDMDYFLKTVALDEDSTMQASSQTAVNVSMEVKTASPSKFMELEEYPSEFSFKDGKKELLGLYEPSSPLCKSPDSPNLDWNFNGEHFSEFMLRDSPKALRFD